MKRGSLLKADVFLIGMLISICISAVASPAISQDRVYRVGLLSAGSDQLLPGQRTTWRSGVLQVLEQRGYHLGKNLQFVDKYAHGDIELLPKLAGEIAKANIDIAVAVTDQSLTAILAQTSKTPVVMVVGSDPVEAGFVTNLARPGGRVTGIAFQTLAGDIKRLQLLHEAMPAARAFGYLRPPGPIPTQTAERLEQASKELGIKLTTHVVTALEPAAYEAAFAAIRNEGGAAVLVAATQQMAIQAPVFGPALKSAKLPTMCEWDYMAHTDCVMSFGHHLDYARRRVGDYVARILAGTQAGELPVEESDVWKLTINLRNAAQVGLVVAPSIDARADDIVE